jgi:hypothetical protein
MTTTTTALVLGAGFSRWAAGLPTVADLFDFQLQVLSKTEDRWLSAIEALKGAWDAEHAGTHAEEFIRHVLLGGKRRQKRYLLWYITRRLSDPFLAPVARGTQTLMIDESRKMGVEGVLRARDFLLSLQQIDLSGVDLSGIVTPNYDLLVEYALGTSGFNYGTPGEVLSGRGKNPWWPWQGAWPKLSGDLPIAKVHGSLSWSKGEHFTDGRCGLRGNADIIPPLPLKSCSALFRDVWELASAILQASESVLVFGFAFNPYDRALLELLSSADSVGSALLVDPAPPITRAKGVWPKATILGCQPPPEGWPTIEAWLTKGSV